MGFVAANGIWFLYYSEDIIKIVAGPEGKQACGK
jgi:hypothetical protein